MLCYSSNYSNWPFSPWELIERWNVAESMGIAPVNLFKTTKGNSFILWASFEVNPRLVEQTVFLREICKKGKGVAGPGRVLLLVRFRSCNFLSERPPTQPPFTYIHPGLCFGSTSLFLHRTMGAILLQFLFSDLWNKDQFGYTTIHTQALT